MINYNQKEGTQEREVTKMTIREMITALETMAQEVGEDTVVGLFDSYTEAEGYDYTQDDLRYEASALTVYTRENGEAMVIVD